MVMTLGASSWLVLIHAVALKLYFALEAKAKCNGMSGKFFSVLGVLKTSSTVLSGLVKALDSVNRNNQDL